MKQFFFVLAGAMLISFVAQAQTSIDADHILRGSFVEEKTLPGVVGPMQTSGIFTVAPATGLIWQMMKPLPTSTIITPNGAVQDIGGMVMKLHAKNLHHLYDMVGGALAGDWSRLEQDFTLTRSGTEKHWQVLLTPRNDGDKKSPYSSITVSGGDFVENIALLQLDGSSDTFTFSNAVLSPKVLSAQEVALFSEVRP